MKSHNWIQLSSQIVFFFLVDNATPLVTEDYLPYNVIYNEVWMKRVFICAKRVLKGTLQSELKLCTGMNSSLGWV